MSRRTIFEAAKLADGVTLATMKASTARPVIIGAADRDFEHISEIHVGISYCVPKKHSGIAVESHRAERRVGPSYPVFQFRHF